jgi:hypothetical protein
MSFVRKWVELENTLTEIRKSENNKYCIFSLIYRNQM